LSISAAVKVSPCLLCGAFTFDVFVVVSCT
jgi:hypothetical protein